MDSVRQQKVGQLVQKELSEIFQRETRGLFGSNVLISVTQVRISPDMGVVKVYISIFGATDKKAMFAKVKEESKEIRMMLSARVGKQMRIIPNLDFFLDDSLDYAMHIDQLLKGKK